MNLMNNEGDIDIGIIAVILMFAIVSSMMYAVWSVL